MFGGSWSGAAEDLSLLRCLEDFRIMLMKTEVFGIFGGSYSSAA